MTLSGLYSTNETLYLRYRHESGHQILLSLRRANEKMNAK